MKILFYLKHSSVRTKFIIFVFALFVVINAFVSVYYPRSVYNTQLKLESEYFLKSIEKIVDYQIGANIDDDEAYINTVITKLEHLPYLEYIATRFIAKEYTNPADKFSFDQIDSLTVNRVHKVNGADILALNILLNNNSSIGEINLKVGFNIQKVLSQREKAQNFSFLVFFISAVLIYACIFFFDRFFFVPLKKLINISRLVSIGQDTVQENKTVSLEFGQIIAYQENTAKRMAELRQDNKMIPLSLRKSQKRAEEIQKNLDKELETMSNLVLYILELRKESSKGSIYRNIVKEVTVRLGYSLCFLFKYDNGNLLFERSNMRGLTILDDKIRLDLKGYVISDKNSIIEEMQKHYPVIRSELPFNDIMNKYNLTGTYAFIPISTAKQFYGILIVGKLGETGHIQHKDLEKLMLLANTVALHIENLDNLKNLERNVMQRTDELKTTNRLLSESIEEKDTMMKLVSHDLNAPLRNVIGLVESIERKMKDELSPDLQNRLSRIRKNVEKELNMIDEILTNFKSNEATELDQPVDMNMLINEILEDLSYELKRKNVKVKLGKNLATFYSNRIILKHIFLNLLDNACKYMPNRKRGNKIEILYAQEEEFCTFQISDNGPGIPLEKQRYIFNAYTQGATSPDMSGGKGLGLALVKNMVGKIGGEITLSSKDGKGSSFFIKFNLN